VRILRNIDVALLVLALPVFIAADLPMLGWAATTVSWLAARWLQAYAERRAAAKGTRQAALGARAASLIGRLYLVTASVFFAGLIEREAAVAAGALAVVVFTAYFIQLFISNTFGEDAR
jgi:membrane protein implicated in regulation of membrane protease activity